MTTVVKRNGLQDKFKIEKVEKTLLDVMKGINHVSLERIMEEFNQNIYEGVNTKDLMDILILCSTSLIEEAPEYEVLAGKILIKKLYKEASRGKKGLTYFDLFRNNLEYGVEKGILDCRLLNFDLSDLSSYIQPERDDKLRYMGLQTLYERYYMKIGGNRLEMPQAFWMRVAMGLALDDISHVKEFYDEISLLRLMPSTPMLFHAGTTHPQLASCYLNTVCDDLHHIFKVYSDNAQLSKYSGGIGTDFTSLRATGAHIKTTGVESQGLIPFLKIQNDVTVAINRSGKRRGAACVYCEAWHYDIEDFIDLKRNTGDERRRCPDLNTALWVPDLFMKRVEEDGDWTLFSPDEVPDLHEIYGGEFDKRYAYYEMEAEEGRIRLHKVLKAKNLWKKIITSLFETGHPWITWKDPCNIRSPQDHVGVVHASNLCTEIIENTSKDETSVCTLLSTNLPEFVNSAGKFMYEEFGKTVRIGVRMLDNSIDLSFYPTKEAEHSHLKHRPLGMGQMGWQDVLFKMGWPFESEKADELTNKINEHMLFYAIESSADLAKERGKYSSYEGSKWDRRIYPFDTFIDNNLEHKKEWDALKDMVGQCGLRNSLLLAIAPNATISTIVGSYPCIEPAFSNLYVKSNINGEFTIINRYLVEDLRGLGLWSNDMLDDIKRYDGSIQKIRKIPSELKEKYKTAFEIDPKRAIDQTSIRTKWIDQSQSHNIFFAGKSGKAISDIYFYAWKKGLKTTYYLRTIGASHIEKSTIKTDFLGSEGRNVPDIDNVCVGLGIDKNKCSIENPECESCQ